MKFDDPEVIDSICYQMRMAEYPRGRNRALINNLFNGFPPYSAEEQESNNINVNVNFLEGTRLGHDARSQFFQAAMKPGNFFNSKCDSGPEHKRQEWSNIVTSERNKIMKRSMVYFEVRRSKIAQNVLHGISPSVFRDQYKWCPFAAGVEDVFVPSNTLLTMENLPFFAVYRQFTAPELIRLVQDRYLDPGWDRQQLMAAIKWVDGQAQTLMYNNWPEIWSPEKTQERVKGDGGFYYGDQVPTINVFDFYFWNDTKGVSGWNRRMILDAWSMPQESQVGGDLMNKQPVRRHGKLFNSYKRRFLYDSGQHKVALKREQIINWEFADLSAVAPFRYHSVRSLGFLLYAICHLQNRLRCKLSEAVFEQLMIYFKVSSNDDLQRALAVDLVNRGFIDDTTKFVPASERYQVNAPLAQMGITLNQQLINENSGSFIQNKNFSNDRVEKTKFQVMAEVNAMTTLVSAALTQSYIYQAAENREVARRFQIMDSPDPEVRQFQSNCLRRGVSSKVLYNPECWEHEADRVMGSGNKTLELAIAEQLMQYRNLYDPEPQRQILRDVTLAITDDPGRANALVPENPIKITDSVHDAQLAMGTLMAGLPVAVKTGINHIEYVDTMMATLATMIQGYRQTGEIPDQSKLKGMMNVWQNIQQHIQIIAQDKNEQQRVKQYQDQLGKIGNVLKAFMQQLQEQQQKMAEQMQQMGQGGDPAAQAKVQAIQQTTQAKLEASKAAHAQRTAQREIQFQMEERRKDAMTQAQIERDRALAQNDLTVDREFTLNDLEIDRAKAASEVALEHKKQAAAPKKVDSGKSGD